MGLIYSTQGNNHRAKKSKKELREKGSDSKRREANRNRQNADNYKPYKNKGLSFFLKESTIKVKSIPKIKEVSRERQTSFGERMVAEWLLKNGIKFKREKQFQDLFNPKTKQLLWLDFYIFSHKTVIEFDGRQHFEACDAFDVRDSLEERMFRDRVKNNYCKKRGFAMVRIRYDQLKQIDSILKYHFFKGKPIAR